MIIFTSAHDSGRAWICNARRAVLKVRPEGWQHELDAYGGAMAALAGGGGYFRVQPGGIVGA
ncbi:MAG: hypothetical protein NTY53_15375, partial [Kiritimatiellaeota bacterium]|nr:hypothetical protein [Kiritimatiellota bacterium]